MGEYFTEMQRAMNWLAQQENSIFMGQAVAFPGTAMSNTLEQIDSSKLLELPVDEELQLGMSIGYALNGFTPISIFPRWNFLLVATNQLVNHLDKLNELQGNSQKSKVIVRTGIGSVSPMHPGPQHVGDFTDPFKMLCKNMNIVRLDDAKQIFPAYEESFLREDGVSTIIVEWSDRYNE